MVNEALDNAEDIVLIRQATDREKWIFAVNPGISFKKIYFEKTLSNPNEADVNAFSGHWKFNEETGEITGSSTFLGLRFDEAIRHSGLWVPGVSEARDLDAQRRLTNGVYRDYGIAVYNSNNPNAQIAQTLIERADKEGWELPILASFRDLMHEVNPRIEYGANILFVEKPQALITGENAKQILSSFRWKGNSGVCRLDRDFDGYWDTDWSNLAYSNADGRVGDWVCGEATRTDLKTAYESLSERQYSVRRRELEEERQTQTEAFNNRLKGK